MLGVAEATRRPIPAAIPRPPGAVAETPPEPAAKTPHAWRPARFMVIVAHPDDADFGPAATAARWIADGSEGWLVCCTSGDAGADDWRTDPLELAATREAEQRAAADVVGLCRDLVPPPARRRARQRPRAARAARARDPDVPARCRAGGGPGDAVLRRRGREPHRPPGRRASPPSTPSIRRRATGWRSRGSRATAWSRTSSAACTCSGRVARRRGSTSAARSTGSSRRSARTRASCATPRSSSRASASGRRRRGPRSVSRPPRRCG